MKKGHSKNRHSSRGASKRNCNSYPVIHVNIIISYKDSINEKAEDSKDNLKWTKIFCISQIIDFVINFLFRLIDIL